MDFYSELEKELDKGEIKTKRQLSAVKLRIAKNLRMDWIPGDSEILNSETLSEKHKSLLTIKKTRTISGVAVVAAMTSPANCPHGKCIYCPGGEDQNSPQAYTGYEPAALRGRNYDYDPYEIVFGRLKQLDTIGHDTSKVDLIIMGGTFTARDLQYQVSYVKGCLDAMNRSISNTLEDSIHSNEVADRRCVGLTVETKPDWFMQKHIDLALSYGTTKVELGIQNINASILKLNNRGHGIGEIVKSTMQSRDSGLKIVYHLMPGMYGSSPSEDKKSFDRMIGCEAYRPDMLKIYPTLVVRGTSLYRLWKSGKYQLMDTEDAVDVIAYCMSKMPEWIRIQRIQRDIPVDYIAAGVKRSDIRNLVEDALLRYGIDSREIRRREVFSRSASDKEIQIRRTDYNASLGKEIFLQAETSEGNIAGFVRLRIPSVHAARTELKQSGIVREIKVLGKVVPIGSDSDAEWQHRGIGRTLLSQAEQISLSEFGMDRIAVTSGIGVREYFRKLSYHLSGPYMVKDLHMGERNIS